MTAMTVGELIEALKDIDPSLPVTVEGCCCDRDLGAVRITEGLIDGSDVLQKVVALGDAP